MRSFYKLVSLFLLATPLFSFAYDINISIVNSTTLHAVWNNKDGTSEMFLTLDKPYCHPYSVCYDFGWDAEYDKYTDYLYIYNMAKNVNGNDWELYDFIKQHGNNSYDFPLAEGAEKNK